MSLDPFSQQTLIQLFQEAEQAAQGSSCKDDDWVAMLEFVPRPGDSLFDVADISHLGEALREWNPSALYCPDRYAIQFCVTAYGPGAALQVALARHEEAFRADEKAPPRCVRSEIVTRAEFDHDSERDLAAARPAIKTGLTVALGKEVDAATRALVDARTPAEVTAILVRIVASMGGDIEIGPGPRNAHEASVDTRIE